MKSKPATKHSIHSLVKNMFGGMHSWVKLFFYWTTPKSIILTGSMKFFFNFISHDFWF